MDKKRLNHEEVGEIKQGEIDAWNRGQGDAVRNKLLTASSRLSTKRAVSLVKMYAQLGDIHFLSTKFDVTPEEVRRILGAFEVRSIEDAKAIVNSGIIAELDQAEEEGRIDRANENLADHAEASQRLVEQQEALKQKVKPQEEADALMAQRRDEAQRKNKEDQLRSLIAQGLDPADKNAFRIPLARVRDFKKMIPHGVSYLKRQFGGSAADIVGEIKRLAPEYQTDMLRP